MSEYKWRQPNYKNEKDRMILSDVTGHTHNIGDIVAYNCSGEVHSGIITKIEIKKSNNHFKDYEFKIEIQNTVEGKVSIVKNPKCVLYFMSIIIKH